MATMTDESRDRPAGRVHVRVFADGQQPGGGAYEIDAREIGGPRLVISELDMSFFRLAGTQAGWEAAFRMIFLGAALQKATAAQLAGLPTEAAVLTAEDKDRLAIVCQYLHGAI
ncbi:MAG: hypothetical protein M3380_04745, partial [Chloroflexota bacterium]|nr:hypothetical protein [Chloroflexota bacterium]